MPLHLASRTPPGTMPPFSVPPRSAAMFILIHLDTPPPESLKSQVLQMVVDYPGDISPVSLQPSNPLYQLYTYVVGFEVLRYRERRAGAHAGRRAKKRLVRKE